MRHIRPALVLIVLFTALTGLGLPLGLSRLAETLVPSLAGGSLVERGGVVVGSALLGQSFTSPKYFHGRPSATTDTDPNDASKTIAVPYDANNSGGSNLGPTSKALLDRVRGDVAANGPAPVPGDMVTSSASGLDPDISPDNAQRQVARVAAARGMPEADLRKLVEAHVQGRALGFIGEPRVDVLALNLALDAATAH